MPDPDDDLEARLAILEREIARLREQSVLISSDAATARVDAAAARVLASGADHDVSEVRLAFAARLARMDHWAIAPGQRAEQATHLCTVASRTITAR